MLVIQHWDITIKITVVGFGVRCAEMTVPNVLSVLCSNDMTARRHLESQQALFHQFAKIIDFTLKFDDLKVRSHSQWHLVWQQKELSCFRKQQIRCCIFEFQEKKFNWLNYELTSKLKITSFKMVIWSVNFFYPLFHLTLNSSSQVEVSLKTKYGQKITEVVTKKN